MFRSKDEMTRYYYYKAMSCNLYGGENLMSLADNEIINFLDRHNIRVVLNLAGNPYQLRRDIEVKYVEIKGMPEKKKIDCCIRIIEEAMRADKSVLVHCDRGIDRTGCVIGSYL